MENQNYTPISLFVCIFFHSIALAVEANVDFM